MDQYISDNTEDELTHEQFIMPTSFPRAQIQ